MDLIPLQQGVVRKGGIVFIMDQSESQPRKGGGTFESELKRRVQRRLERLQDQEKKVNDDDDVYEEVRHLSRPPVVQSVIPKPPEQPKRTITVPTEGKKNLTWIEDKSNGTLNEVNAAKPSAASAAYASPRIKRAGPKSVQESDKDIYSKEVRKAAAQMQFQPIRVQPSVGIEQYSPCSVDKPCCCCQYVAKAHNTNSKDAFDERREAPSSLYGYAGVTPVPLLIDPSSNAQRNACEDDEANREVIYAKKAYKPPRGYIKPEIMTYEGKGTVPPYIYIEALLQKMEMQSLTSKQGLQLMTSTTAGEAKVLVSTFLEKIIFEKWPINRCLVRGIMTAILNDSPGVSISKRHHLRSIRRGSGQTLADLERKIMSRLIMLTQGQDNTIHNQVVMEFTMVELLYRHASPSTKRKFMLMALSTQNKPYSFHRRQEWKNFLIREEDRGNRRKASNPIRRWWRRLQSPCDNKEQDGGLDFTYESAPSGLQTASSTDEEKGPTPPPRPLQSVVPELMVEKEYVRAT